MTSAILSVTWATHRLSELVLAWQLWSACLTAGDSTTNFGENLKLLTAG